jgi:hypothetical protein
MKLQVLAVFGFAAAVLAAPIAQPKGKSGPGHHLDGVVLNRTSFSE